MKWNELCFQVYCCSTFRKTIHLPQVAIDWVIRQEAVAFNNGVFGQVTVPKTGNLKQSTKIGGHGQYFTSFKILTRNKIAINMRFANPEVLLKNQNWLKVYQKKSELRAACNFVCHVTSALFK